ncbi:hypothetical protein EV182_003247, partial [Spiromyces aspiralis]
MPVKEMRFDNRVVVVTGAGGGIGKVYALYFAKRGASVVVNDIGTVKGSDGQPIKAADLVVDEIRKAGGKAAANYDSVENGGKGIIGTAMHNFGRVDIILNNAGILRDRSFKSMSDQEWDAVIATHLRGSYSVTKAAWEIMRKQKFGRIIMTSSAAGIYGNFGQANYSAAKHALIGFSNSLAREGAKYNITCNTIAPLAASRMTETVMPKEILDILKPEFIAPLVAFLTHESSVISGGLFELGGGYITAHRWEATKGVIFRADESFTPAAVQARWKDICNFSSAVSHPTSLADSNWLELLEEAKKLPPNPQSPELRFDNKVVIVSGAGGGLGRAYALMFARHGAKVVVNDVGASSANAVVDEIRKAGGEAVASHASVEDGEKIVNTALKSFGRVDVVVNNAGILRDRSFKAMTDEEWDLVYRVHLRGTYKLSKAVWPIFIKQKGGAIINTSSAVGIFGNFGQTNYSAAKAGIQGLTNTLAIEGAKYNIRVNAIAPNAGTRMTATIMPPEIVEMLKPDYVAPLVGYLAHDSCKTTGKLFQVGSCWISEIRRERTGGYVFNDSSEPMAPEAIRNRWSVITNFDDGRAHHVRTIQENTMQVLEEIRNAASKGGKKPDGVKPKGRTSKEEGTAGEAATMVDVKAAREARFEPADFPYSERDVILYALGIGASRRDLDFVYENSLNFQAFPTFAVIPIFKVSVPFNQFLPTYNPMMLLHGEQYLELSRALPTSGSIKVVPSIIDIQDKGKGAVVVSQLKLVDAVDGNTIGLTQSTVFIRGIGGFSKHPQFKALPPAERPEAAVATNIPPSTAPEAVVSQKTSEDQAAIYRLSGDLNPLHIDPELSKLGGFKTPILHGLCTFGYAARHVIQAAAGGNASHFKNMKARFSAP